MIYDKKKFQEELSILFKEEIMGVFFHPHVNDKDYPELTENNIEYCKSYGFFIHTKTGKWFTISETDYSDLSDFTGVKISPFEHSKNF